MDIFTEKGKRGLDEKGWINLVAELQEKLNDSDLEENDREALTDMLRYAMVWLKESVAKGGISLESAVNSIISTTKEDAAGEVEDVDSKAETTKQNLLAELEASELTKINKKKLAIAVARGAALGALAGAGAGLLADAIESGQFDGLAGRAGEMLTAAITSLQEVGVEINGGVEASDTGSTSPGTEAPATTEAAAAAVEVLPLGDGSNPWNTVEASLGFNPTNAEMVEIMKGVATDSGFSVDEWGITVGPDDQALPVGFEIKIGPATQELIEQIRARH